METRGPDIPGTEKRDPLEQVEGKRDVFERESGSELAEWERTFVSDFRKRIGGQLYRFRGFVRHTRYRSLFFVSPSPWLASGTPICLDPDEDAPPDGSFVEVIGRRLAVPHLIERNGTSVEAFMAESVKSQPLDVTRIIPRPMQLSELSELLFEHVGLEESSKAVFTRLFISSPPYADSVGGLTCGVQAQASQRHIRQLLSFMRGIVPPSFRNRRSRSIDISGIQVDIPRLWRLEVGTYSPAHLRKLCVERRDMSGFREVSLSTLTDPNTSTLPDIPLVLTSDDFWIEPRDWGTLRLPITKSIITYQLLSPQVSEQTIVASVKHVLRRIEHIKEIYGLPDTVMCRGGLLDADQDGRSLSAIRVARSTARSQWKERIVVNDVRGSWDRVLEPALRSYIELVQVKADAADRWGEEARIEKFSTKLLKVLSRLDSGTTTALGPTLDEIAVEAGMDVHQVAAELSKMKEAGVLYEPRPGHFRLV
ncbi:MAG: hypothetical protein QXS20_07685 [Candidatus Thorarchaeota archaeon]